MKLVRRLPLLLLCLFPLLASCSINKLVADALTGSVGGDVFTGDTDPELVAGAIPFAIKMYEALLAQNPNHQGLLLTTGSLFVMYANAFVQGPAEMLNSVDYFEERNADMDRAKQLYLRGYAILSSALEKKYRGFSTAKVEDGTLAPLLKKCKKNDVELLYWTVAGGLAAYSIDVFDFELGSSIPEWGEMIARAYELDPDFNQGAINDFYILYYASLPETLGGNINEAVKHFNMAVEKSHGLSAGPYVSYAKAICVPAQDYNAYKENLEKALAIDTDADPGIRLVNILSQRKARYLLENAYEYFSFLPYHGGR